VSRTDLIALIPLLVLGSTAVAAMLAIAVRRSHRLVWAVSTLGLVASLLALPAALPVIPRTITSLLVVDRFGLYFTGLVLAATLAVVLFSFGYFERQNERREEFYVLALTGALGAAVLPLSTHFVSFFLGLEILSVTLYAMAAYLPERRVSVEAGLKYLVLAAASAAFLLFGMALIYARTGTMTFAGLAQQFDQGAAGHPWVLAGLGLLLTGFGFKLAVVPFHLWTPDVYQGAPAPSTAFIASVSKGAMFAVLLRFFMQSGARDLRGAETAFAILAVLSMVAGNLLALLQNNVKRLLAYSSIAHLGYLLVAFLAGGGPGTAAAVFYLTAYMVTILGAFGALAVLSDARRDCENIAELRGLFWRRPILGTVFAAMMFSLAGIPLTGGFLGKFYAVAAGASARLWALVLILVVTSAIGLYYYLRVVVAVFATETAPAAGLPATPPLSGLVLLGLGGLLLWLGIYPRFFLDLIQAAVSGLL
jgi:NADH-quinone oxidoreductase subunit N